MLHTTHVATIGVRTAAAVLATALLAAPNAEAEHASTPHPFKSASVSWSPSGGRGAASATILVGHDGSKYTHLVGELSTRFRIRAEVKTGYRIHGWIVAMADPDTLTPSSLLLSFSKQAAGAEGGAYERTLDRNVTFTLPAATAINRGIPGISLVPHEQQAIDQCNNAFSEPPPTEQVVGQVILQVHAGFSSGKKALGAVFVDWDIWWPTGRASGRPAIAFSTFPATIVCLSKTDPRVGELPPPQRAEPPFRVTSANLTLFHDSQPLPAKLEAECPVPIGHNALFSTIGKLPATMKYHFEWTTGQRSTDYSKADKGDRKDPLYEPPTAYHEFPYPLPKGVKGAKPGPDGLVAAKLPTAKGPTGKVAGPAGPANEHKGSVRVVVSGPAGEVVSSGWAAYHIVCKQRPEVLSGTLDLRDPNGSACPRQAEAALSITTNAAGPVSYRLDCTGDRTWSGTAEAKQTAPNTFIAVDVLAFHIKDKEQVNCSLKSQSPTKVIALRGRAYACARSSGSGLVADPKSEPPRLVADPPRPTCMGGSVVTTSTRPTRYGCRCPSGQPPQTTGLNSFRCQGTTTISISCAGGTIRSGQCVCPANMRRVQAGANAWRCMRAVQSVPRNIAPKRPALPPSRRR
jgi:hypothetical protein